MHTFSFKYSSKTHCSLVGHGIASEHSVDLVVLPQPDLNGSPEVPPGHWQVKEPGSFLQMAPDPQGLPAHSSMSVQPKLVPVNPALQIHWASWLMSIHSSFGPHIAVSQGSTKTVIMYKGIKVVF